MEDERVVTKEEAKEYANKYQIPFLECSAKNRENIDEIFLEIVREVRKSQNTKNSNQDDKKCFLF